MFTKNLNCVVLWWVFMNVIFNFTLAENAHELSSTVVGSIDCFVTPLNCGGPLRLIPNHIEL